MIGKLIFVIFAVTCTASLGYARVSGSAAHVRVEISESGTSHSDKLVVLIAAAGLGFLGWIGGRRRRWK